MVVVPPPPFSNLYCSHCPPTFPPRCRSFITLHPLFSLSPSACVCAFNTTAIKLTLWVHVWMCLPGEGGMLVAHVVSVLTIVGCWPITYLLFPSAVVSRDTAVVAFSVVLLLLFWLEYSGKLHVTGKMHLSALLIVERSTVILSLPFKHGPFTPRRLWLCGSLHVYF